MRRFSTLRLVAAATVVLSFSFFGLAAASAGSPAAVADGYWLVSPQGAVFPYGGASTLFGPASTLKGLHAPIVGVAATPSRDGYWMVAADGGVFAFGQAKFYGSLGNRKLQAPIAGIAASPSGHGYWLVGQDAMPGYIVGIQTNTRGWLVGADGGVYAFGDAAFFGSAAGRHNNEPFVGITAS